MPSETISQYVQDMFKRLLFQDDDNIALEALDELASDALICINGNTIPRDMIGSIIMGQIRANSTAVLTSFQVINFTPTTSGGCLAMTTRFTTTGKSDGLQSKHVATTLLTVTEKEGRKTIQQLFEVSSLEE